MKLRDMLNKTKEKQIIKIHSFDENMKYCSTFEGKSKFYNWKSNQEDLNTDVERIVIRKGFTTKGKRTNILNIYLGYYEEV